MSCAGHSGLCESGEDTTAFPIRATHLGAATLRPGPGQSLEFGTCTAGMPTGCCLCCLSTECRDKGPRLTSGQGGAQEPSALRSLVVQGEQA